MFDSDIRNRRTIFFRPQNQFWTAVLLCALMATLLFLPFQIIDGGFFHYAGDFNGQQITFYRYMNGFVKGGYPDASNFVPDAANHTFSWATDLGSGVMNAYSFYLYGSPFFWLSTLFPQSWMPYLMCPLLVLKFAVAGGGAYLYSCRYVRQNSHAVLSACLYAFSGFAVYSIFFNHFVDVVALFPWMLWSLDETLHQKKRGLFALFVALNLFNNYFFFVGQVVFLLIYFVCKLVSGEFRLTVRLLIRLALESLLGCAMTAILSLPAFLSVTQNPRTLSFLSGWDALTYSSVQQYFAIVLSWILPQDSPYLPSLWSQGIIKWTNMTAYLPLCSLAGVLTYWTQKRRGDSNKRIITVCIVCSLVPILNSMFYAFNSSYYARWYYMPLLLLSVMSVNGWEEPEADLLSPIKKVAGVMLLTLVFALVPAQNKTTEEWSLGVLKTPCEYWAVLGFGLVGLLVYYQICRRSENHEQFFRRMTAAVAVFAVLYGMVNIGIGKFGQLQTDSNLVFQDTSAARLSFRMPEGDYRIDTYKTHDNLGMWLDKSCLEYFGSTVSPSILYFYPSVGVKRDVRSEPDISNSALRSLLSVKYTLMQPIDEADFVEEAGNDWSYYDTLEGFSLYQNDNYIPFGFTYDYYITEEELDYIPKTDSSRILLRALVVNTADEETFLQYLAPLPQTSYFDTSDEQYKLDCSERRASACTRFIMTNGGFHAENTLDRENFVFFSVPFDKGFTARVNGKNAEIYRVDNGLLAILCPAGENQIDVVYQAYGYSLGKVFSLLGIVLYLCYLLLPFFYKKYRHIL